MRAAAATATVLVVAGLAAPAAATSPADKVLRDGRIHTLDRGDRVVRAIAIRDGRVVFAGSDRRAAAYIGPRTRVLDLNGRMAMPGLVDGHAHPLGGGDILDDCDLGNAEGTIAELQAVIAKCDAEDPATSDRDWLEVSNWSPVGVEPEGTIVSRADLDAVSTQRPIIVTASDFHNAWVNTRALELAKVDASTPDPPDGEIVRDPDGSPRGLLKDGAISLVTRAIPEKRFADHLRDGRRALKALAAQGITTTSDAAAGRLSARVWSTLSRRGRLTARVAPYLEVAPTESPRKALTRTRALARRYATRDVPITTVKLFLDGVMEYPAHTAALLEPYLVTGKSGTLYFPTAKLNTVVERFDADGWRIHMHTIGDAAVRQGLDAIAAARRANGAHRGRFALTHLQLVDPTDLRRFGRLGVWANMQLQWAVRNVWTEESLAPYIGPERASRIYPARSLIRAGAPLSQGSDWPVDPLNPWLELDVAVTRTGETGTGRLNPDQAITLDQALRAHTIDAARQLGLQRRVGSLAVGKEADVIVLDRHIRKARPTNVRRIRVDLTLFRGRTVYRRAGARSARLLRLIETRAEPGGRSHSHDRDREH